MRIDKNALGGEIPYEQKDGAVALKIKELNDKECFALEVFTADETTAKLEDIKSLVLDSINNMPAALKEELVKAGTADIKKEIKNELMKELTYKAVPKGREGPWHIYAGLPIAFVLGGFVGGYGMVRLRKV